MSCLWLQSQGCACKLRAHVWTISTLPLSTAVFANLYATCACTAEASQPRTYRKRKLACASFDDDARSRWRRTQHSTAKQC
eukprot:2818941-Rhodomonas_salina.3